MNKRIKLVFSLLILLSLVPLPLLSSAPSANSTHTYTITVAPLSGRILVVNLDKGDKFEGSLSISGGGGDDISFWVTDPQGNTILDLGRVIRGKAFQFEASASGGYALHFDNSFSIISYKVVTLSYDIKKAIIPGVPAEATGIFIGLIMVVIVLIAAIGYLVARFRKRAAQARDRQKENPIPPPNFSL